MAGLITRDELRVLIETGSVTVLDTLPEFYYCQQHLPGAVNLVAEDVLAKASRLLPDKSAAIVTYCSNAGCTNSQAVANLLTKLGYTNVRKYRECIQDWVEAGLPVETGDPAGPPGA